MTSRHVLLLAGASLLALAAAVFVTLGRLIVTPSAEELYGD